MTKLTKLTEEKVREARRLHVPGTHKYGCGALARKNDVHRNTMVKVLTKVTWKHVK